MQIKYSTIDFEFFNPQEPHPTLVCAVLNDEKYWLFNDTEQIEKLKQDIINQKDSIFLAYYSLAEARCFEAMGLNSMAFQWIDLYSEFKMQQNSNNSMQYGAYIDSKGLQSFSTPPKKEENETEDSENNKKVPSNLINAVFKNTGKKISKKEKEEVRDIILSKDKEKIEFNKERILNYCLEDTTYLIPLWENIKKFYLKNGLRNFEKDSIARGKYAAATAKCEQLGIPINDTLLRKIIEKTPEILDNSKQDINKIFKADFYRGEIIKPPKIFKNGKIHHYKPEPPKKDTRIYQEFIKKLNIEDFPKTESGLFSSDKKTLETYRYIEQIEALYQHNKLESSLKWFNEGNSDGFFEAYGSDNTVRPFYGIFGTQTGRNAAKAKTFPFAMSSWMRAIMQPKEGEYIIGADFSQQEIAVGAWLSQDKNLISAYESGDTYLAFAKLAGAVPENATKESHEPIRDMFKSTKLGIQYGMGKYLLKNKLAYDCKRPFTLEEAIVLINHHKEVFSDYWKYITDVGNKYQNGLPIITKDGWVLWLDNDRMTSVRNQPIQGTSASITRKAKVKAWESGLKVMNSLHDALYIRSTNPMEDEIILRKVMREATEEILGKGCIFIRIDVKVISHSETWVEKKGAKDWDKIKKFIEQ